MSATQRARSAVPLDIRSLAPTVPGVPWWGALAVAAGATAAGILIDSARGNELTIAFNAFYVLGCIAAVVAVRYRGLFTALAQPPLLMLVAVPIGQEVVASGSTGSLKDLALNVAYPLVNRFPVMLLATVAVLLIGGFRIFATRQNTGVKARAARERPGARARAAKTAGRPTRATPAELDRDEPESVRPRRRARPEKPVRTATGTRAKPAARGAAEKASVRDVADTRGNPVTRRRRPAADRAGAEPSVRREREHLSPGDEPRRRPAADPRAPRPATPEARAPRPAAAPQAARPEQGPPARPQATATRAQPTATPSQSYMPPRVRYRDRHED